MLARLGLVLYWTGWVLSGLVLGAGILLSFAMTNAGDKLFVLIAAAIIAALTWLAGRAGRFVLTGD